MSSYVMNSEQKIFESLDVINEANKLTLKKEDVRLYPSDFWSRGLESQEVDSILKLLEDSEWCIEITHRPEKASIDNKKTTDGTYHIKLTEAFLAVYDRFFALTHADVDDLSVNNLLRIAHSLYVINEEYNLSLSSSITITAYEGSDYFWALNGSGSINNTEYRRVFLKAAQRLMLWGVLRDYSFDSNQKKWINLEIEPVKFNEISMKVFNRAKPFLDRYMKASLENDGLEYIQPAERLVLIDNNELQSNLSDYNDTNQFQKSINSKVTQDDNLPSNGYKLLPEYYDKTKGILHLTAFHEVKIAKRDKAKKKDGRKYFECWLMECVFKSVKTLKSGATFSRITGRKSSIIGITEKRKIRNAIDSINKKIAETKGPEKLLIMQKSTVFVNNSYL